MKSVLITGCSSGIGLCVAKNLKLRGYRVFACARKRDDVDKLKRSGLESIHLDLDSSLSIHKAVESVLSASQNQLYGLFNNGAYGQPGAIEDLSRDAIRKQFETNVFGTMELTNLVLPIMRHQGCGRIIQNSSILGFMALAYRGAYVASKYALEAISDTLRLELRHTNIHVSLIEPGPILSKFRENGIAHFHKHVDIENSPHQAAYVKVLKRLETKGAVIPFTLPPEAVFSKVCHALEANRPRIRYHVTVPTVVMAYLRRFLTYRGLDRVLARI